MEYFLGPSHIVSDLTVAYVNNTEKEFELFSLCLPSPADFGKSVGEVYAALSINDYLVFDLTSLGTKETMLKSEIYSEKNRMVLLEADMPGYSKLWVNGVIANISDRRQNKEYILLELQAGINHLHLLYRLKRHSEFPPYVYIQLFDWQAIKQGRLLPRMYTVAQKKRMKAITNFERDKSSMEFMLLPIRACQQVIQLQMDESEPRPYHCFETYRLSLSQSQRNMGFQIYELSDNGQKRNPIFSYLPTAYEQSVVQKANHRLENYEDIELEGRLEKWKNPLTFGDDRYRLIHEMDRSQKGMPGSSASRYTRYYRSEIDNTVQQMVIDLPDSYDASRPYPLIVCLGILDFDYFHPEKNNEYIVLNCSGRGILGGGYISEASYFEAIDKLMDWYPINKDRIYLTGKSNGGYAVWSMIQHYPHLWAAAYPISGYPQAETLQNVEKLPICNYISNQDSCYKENLDEVSNGLRQSKDYEEHRVENMLHHSITEFKWFPILDFFRSKRREEYPRKFRFITKQNQYLQAYWVRLAGIIFGETYASVSVDVITENRIEIQTKNTEGICLTLPPYIQKKLLTIVVNSTAFFLSEVTTESVSFRIGRDVALIPEKELPSYDYRKGIGILHVFCGNVRIGIDDQASPEEMRVAEQFSSPRSNGYYNHVDVHYPILPMSQMTAEHRKNNLILIQTYPRNDNQAFDFSNEWIRCTEEGFWYQGVYHDGPYCVLQAIEHPMVAKKTILRIQANSSEMLRKNMFTRKVALPFMNTGMHPYWNHMALIYYHKCYFGIYEWGMDMQEI